MKTTPKRRALLELLRRCHAKRWSSAELHRAGPLRPEELEEHAKLIADKIPRSGRAGAYVYYWAFGHLCWRRHVIPNDPRTPGQRSSQAAFRAATKAWSENQPLTEPQRRAWRAEAAKFRSRPRLGQSGLLTPQQHFVGRNSVKERWGKQLLLEPPPRSRMNDERRSMKGGSVAQVQPHQWVTQPSSGRNRPSTGPLPSLHRPATAPVTHHASRITHPVSRLPPSILHHASRLTRLRITTIGASSCGTAW